MVLYLSMQGEDNFERMNGKCHMFAFTCSGQTIIQLKEDWNQSISQ